MKNTTKTLFKLASTAGILGASACSSPQVAGTAPELRTLSVAPTAYPSGQTATVAASLGFFDEEGDVTKGILTFSAPNGQSQTMAVPVQNAMNIREGNVGVSLQLALPVRGSYTLSFVLEDGTGRRSNAKEATLTAL